MPGWPASCWPTSAIPGADWVKLECLGDPRTLLPDPVATLQATEQLVKEGFQVLVYTSDDPIMARRLKAAGAASVMPAGSPIGSGQGVLNPNNIRIILEYLKDGDPDYPVIVDAGVGTASDVAVADGAGLRRRAAQHRHRPRPGPAADGLAMRSPARRAGWPTWRGASRGNCTPRRPARWRAGIAQLCDLVPISFSWSRSSRCPRRSPGHAGIYWASRNLAADEIVTILDMAERFADQGE